MDQIKVLFLTNYYPPEKYPRAIQISHLVQYLRTKISLEVLTFPSEKTGDSSLLSFTPLNNVLYAKKSKISMFLEKSRGYFLKKELLLDLGYFLHFDLFKKAKNLIEPSGINVIVTFGQPMSTHIAGLKLKKKFPHLKWIAHFSDPWVDNNFNNFNWWLKFINQHYQDRVFGAANELIFTSQETIDLVMRPYPPSISSKASCLPHCFNPSLYPNSKKQDKIFQIRYLGNFYGDRQPDSLFKALKIIPKRALKNIQIEFVGSGTKNTIKSYGLERNVITKSSIDYLKSLKLMKESDLLLIIDAPAKISPFLPSKLIDYIGANKPIFGITPQGTSQKLITEMGFLTAPPNNPKEISEKLFQMIKKMQLTNGLSIPQKIRDKYSIDVVGQKMLDLLTK